MAVLLLSCTRLIIVCFFGVISKSESRNFPINGCSTDELDVLSLYFHSRHVGVRDDQHSLFDQFVEDILTFQSNKTPPRLMVADVVDGFSAQHASVNISSWNFKTFLRREPYGVDDILARQQKYTNVVDVIVKKTQFIERLFSEMGGVRFNVTHMAVMFVDGTGLTFEEIRSIPRIVEERDTDMKIFVVVVSDQEYLETVYLSDALLVETSFYLKSKHILSLAICNQCMPGWYMLEHTDGTDSISCYKLFTSNEIMSWNYAMTLCSNHGADIAAVETKQELAFLQERLYSELGNLSHVFEETSNVSYKVYIGLSRFYGASFTRFYWQMSYRRPNRPLVINNWMRGKPSGGWSNRCGLWEFVYIAYTNRSKSTSTEHSFLDGWVDFFCEALIASSYLCEMVAPRKVEDGYLWRIKPATTEIFDEALTKGDLIKFGDNIVSVSANIVRVDFLHFLQERGGEFPLFDCGVGDSRARYISYVYVCDHIAHCTNRRDETYCTSEPKEAERAESQYTQICKGAYCCDGLCLPLHLVNDGEIDCRVCEYNSKTHLNDESEVLIHYLGRNESCPFTCNHGTCNHGTCNHGTCNHGTCNHGTCNHGTCVHLSELNDGHKDCTGPEGPLDETIGKLERVNSCYTIFGHIIWSPRCVYVMDKYGSILGCRDMSHLEDCADYDCSEGYFKCPNSYCIPQHYVLNGQHDCPTGEDEQWDDIGPCTGNFACWNSNMCLHPGLICDGHPDCPHGDEEVDCLVSCIEGFRCVSGTVTVSDYNRSIPLRHVYPIDSRIRYLDLSGVDLSVADFSTLSISENVIVIIWSNCQIGNSIIDYFSFLWRVRELDLSYNLIQVLDGNYIIYSPLQNVRYINVSYNRELVVVKYLQLNALEVLDLSHTGLSDLDESFVVGLPNLRHLNLSYTSITDFMIHVFPSNLILQTLDLRGLSIGNIKNDCFKGITIRQHLYSDSFKLCCPQTRGPNIPYYTCDAPEDAISSCFDLVGLDSHRILLWVVAVLGVLGNMAVVVYRVIWDRSILRTGYGLFVTNLGISDFIMGVYLLIISGGGYFYRDNYVLYEKTWRESVACRLAGFLATLSCETSIFFISLITLEKFVILKFPCRQMQFSTRNTAISAFVFWVIGVLLALTPIVFGFNIYSSNAMCFSLPLTTERFRGWEFPFTVFALLNLFLCLIIAYGQRVILRSMTENTFTETELNKCSLRTQDIIEVKQLSLLALSTFVCWCPIGIMGLLSLSGLKISNDVYAWTTVIVFPITSAAHPFLYIWPAVMARWERFKLAIKMS